jgi:glycerol uptake facilitator-like aquaporin
MNGNLNRRLVAEFLGTATLLAVIIGSGIMAERLAGGNVAVALLAHTLAIGAGLFTMIITFAEVSGAHFNPAVTLTQLLNKNILAGEAAAYVAVQLVGAAAGVAVANAMFSVPVFFASQKVRTGPELWLSEFVATFGLIVIIAGTARLKSKFAVPTAVAAYIFAACWFTSSFSFANPAVTFARSLSDTFAGIRPVDVPAFVLVQIIAAVAAMYLSRWLFGSETPA